MRAAILDLGTNTFHLKVIEHDGESIKDLYQTKVFVKLAEEGIEHIGEAAFERGIEVVRIYKNEIDEFKTDKMVAFATAALREADNAAEFIARVAEETGIEIEVISGQREAELIHKGVAQAIQLPERPVLVMDIGGGSAEFIIADRKGVLWANSFPIGAAVLKNRFHKTEPMSSEEQLALQMHLAEVLAPLFKEASSRDIDLLIGASGAFESVAEMIAYEYHSPDLLDGLLSFQIDLDKYKVMHDRILGSTLEERLEFKGLVPMRAEMIVVAVLLIETVVNTIGIEEMYLSTYAMKEGVAAELASL